jgi:ABC-2 type transport system permease protein
MERCIFRYWSAGTKETVRMKTLFTLIGKELLHGQRGFMLVMVIAAPILISLVINLAVGDLFSGNPQLGIYDESASKLVNLLNESPQIKIKKYASTESLKSAVQRGSVGMGVILPATLDSDLAGGRKEQVTLYVWGESLDKDRMVISSTLLQTARELTGQPEPIVLEPVTLGDAISVPWRQRLMPLTVMIAVLFGGLMIPAVSLIDEKTKRTLKALATTPASINSIFIAKGIVGALLSLIMGIIILLMNQAWGKSPFTLLLMLVIAATMAAEIGLLLGIALKDMNTLFAVWKLGGFLLFGPAVVYMFPQLPQWIGYLFPTYYIMRPIMDFSLGTGDTTTMIIAMVGLFIVIALAISVIRLTPRLSGEGAKYTASATAEG